MISTLAVISGSSLIDAVIFLVIAGLICWILWWLVGYCNPPEPFKKIANVLIALVAAVFLINFLLSIVGKPFIRW